MARRKVSDRRSHTKRQQQTGAKPVKKKMPASRKLSPLVPIITLRWGNKKLEIENFVKLLTSVVVLISTIVALFAAIISQTPNMRMSSSTPTASPSYTISVMPTWTSGLANTSSVTATAQPTYTPSPSSTPTTTVTPIHTNLQSPTVQPEPAHTPNPSPTSTTIFLPTITLIPTQSSTITPTDTIPVVATNTSSTPTYTNIPTYTPSIIATSTLSHTPTYTPLVTSTPTFIESMTPIPSDTPSGTSTPAWAQTQTVTTTPFLTYTPTPTPPINEDVQGCSPGFWKNHLESWGQTGYSPTDDFDTVFEVNVFNSDITLEQAVNMQDGGDARLARHGTAALLNAAHPDLHYPLTVTQVIALVKVEDTDTLAEFNDSICPLKVRD